MLSEADIFITFAVSSSDIQRRKDSPWLYHTLSMLTPILDFEWKFIELNQQLMGKFILSRMSLCILSKYSGGALF